MYRNSLYLTKHITGFHWLRFVQFRTLSNTVWPKQNKTLANLTPFGMVQDPIKCDLLWYSTGSNRIWLHLVWCRIPSNLTSFVAIQDPLNSFSAWNVTKSYQTLLCLNSIEPYQTVLRSRSWSWWSPNYLRPGAGNGAGAEIIFQKKFTAVSLEEVRMKKNLQWDVRISYGTTVTAQFQVAKYGSSWSWSRGWSQK